eukprot:TRINITY_DN2278_c0_g1_i2.p1 TRINITY_DN2278_c0_g1~~TRINITY_DN2278_c0_g1_i2.p1  ORF type:complete len:454 (-),score=106.20 TRINITY_DN2278_c0_g1_i2:6-1367(-)
MPALLPTRSDMRKKLKSCSSKSRRSPGSSPHSRLFQARAPSNPSKYTGLSSPVAPVVERRPLLLSIFFFFFFLHYFFLNFFLKPPRFCCSTSMMQVKSRLENIGFTVYLVPEMATLIQTAGVNLHGTTTAQKLAFQLRLLRLQLEMEDAFAALARAWQKPSVLLMDRGTMDGKAYCTREMWDLILEECGHSVVSLRDKRYDAVIHLTTAAKGAVEFYTTANNNTRYETPQQAVALDNRTQDAWVGHPHLYIVDNSSNFDEKVRRVVTRISAIVGAARPKDILRKFLLKTNPSFKLTDLIPASIRVEEFSLDITYISKKPGFESRLRRRGQGGNFFYAHQTQQISEDDPTRVTKLERHVSAREYVAMLESADPHYATIKRTVYSFLYADQYCEINSFLQLPLTFLEVEVETVGGVVDLPPFLEIGEEVTGNPEYETAAIAYRLAASGAPGPAQS